MQVNFIHLTGSKTGQTETVNADRIIVGRNPGSTLAFDPYQDLDVSGEHAQFSMGDDGKLLLTDLNSTNGTFMNGQQVKGPPVLCEPGSKVKFGKNGPECKVDYTPGPAKGGKTRMLLAQVQEDLEKQKQDSASSKKKTLIFAVVAAAIIGIGATIYMVLSGKAQRREKASVSLQAMLDQKSEANDQSAPKLIKDAYDAAAAIEAEAQAAMDAGDFDAARELGEQAKQAYSQVAKVAAAVNAAQEKREEAVGQFADTYAAAELKKGDGLLAQARKKGADPEKARQFAFQARSEYRKAQQVAYFEGVSAAARKAEEQANLQLKAMAEEAERRRAEEIARLEAQAAAADREAQERLRRELDELRKRPPDPSQLLLQTIEIAKKKVMLVEASLYVVADGNEIELDQRRYGTAFLYKNGHIVTAKQTLLPHLFEAELRGQTELLKKQGREIKAKYRVWVYNVRSQEFQVLFSTEKGNLDVGFMAPDKMLDEKQKASIEFNYQMTEVEVDLHDPKLNNLGSLVLKADKLPDGLAAAGSAGEMSQQVVAVGAILDKTTATSASAQGNIARRQGDLVELPTNFEAPRSLVGSPVLNLETKVLGVVVYVGKASVLYQPLADVDKYIN